MKDELYIDVVSKTIISKLSESLARFVGDNVSAEIKKILLRELPDVINNEIGPVVSNAQIKTEKATENSEKKVLKLLL